MEKEIENIDKIIEYWKESSNQDFQTMNNLVNSKDYSWALFIGHLVLEKLLKAVYVKKYNAHAIPTHDLLRLAKKIGLQLTEEQEEWFDNNINI